MRLLPLLLVAAALLAGCATNGSPTPTPSATPSAGASPTPTAATASPASTPTPAAASGDSVKMETSKGTIVFHLDADVAPQTVAHVKQLVSQGFYDGIPFHRYVADFVVQGGDPNCKTKGISDPSCGTGGSGTTVPAEFNGKHDYGAVGLARAQDPGSGDSQFYFVINQQGDHDLDGQYCVFGHVTQGLDVMLALRAGDVMTKVTLV